MYYRLLVILISLSLSTVQAAKKPPVTDGKYIEYRKNGKIKLESNYKNGLLNGQRIKYHKDGTTIKQVTIYKQGKKTGLEKFYGKEGILKNFKNWGAG